MTAKILTFLYRGSLSASRNIVFTLTVRIRTHKIKFTSTEDKTDKINL